MPEFAFAFIDCEFGGLDPELHDITEIALIPALSLRQAATSAGLIEGAVPHRAMADSRLTLDTFRYFVGTLRGVADRMLLLGRHTPENPA